MPRLQAIAPSRRRHRGEAMQMPFLWPTTGRPSRGVQDGCPRADYATKTNHPVPTRHPAPTRSIDGAMPTLLQRLGVRWGVGRDQGSMPPVPVCLFDIAGCQRGPGVDSTGPHLVLQLPQVPSVVRGHAANAGPQGKVSRLRRGLRHPSPARHFEDTRGWPPRVECSAAHTVTGGNRSRSQGTANLELAATTCPATIGPLVSRFGERTTGELQPLRQP
jgi:hypothetical protein